MVLKTQHRETELFTRIHWASPRLPSAMMMVSEAAAETTVVVVMAVMNKAFSTTVTAEHRRHANLQST
jgi:hypothetical protein